MGGGIGEKEGGRKDQMLTRSCWTQYFPRSALETDIGAAVWRKKLETEEGAKKSVIHVCLFDAEGEIELGEHISEAFMEYNLFAALVKKQGLIVCYIYHLSNSKNVL